MPASLVPLSFWCACLCIWLTKGAALVSGSSYSVAMLGPALSGRPAPAVNPRNPADFGFWLHLPLLRRCQLVDTSWQAAPAPPPCPACGSGHTMVLKMRQVRPGKPRETPGRVVWWWLSLTFSGVVVVFVLMPCRVTVDPPPPNPAVSIHCRCMAGTSVQCMRALVFIGGLGQRCGPAFVQAPTHARTVQPQAPHHFPQLRPRRVHVGA